MDDTAVEAATSQMGFVSLEPHETTRNEKVPLVSLPIEIFFEIVSHLVHDIRSWQHQLDYLTHDHLIALTQRVKIGHLRSLALTCRTMQRKVALFCCAQADLVVPRLDAAEQLVGLLRRLGERPKRAQSVRRLYLGLDTVRCYAERIDPHIPLLMQAACATPGVAVPEILRKRMREVQDKTACPTACLQLWPAIPEVLAFLALLSTSRLKELQECTIATGPEVLAAMAERLPRGEPFFPKIESLTLAGVRSAYGNQSLVLEPSVVSGFLATSPQLTGLRLDRFEFRLAQPVTGVENISSIILRSVALDVPSFRLLLKGCKRLGTFMYFAQSEADCGARQDRQLPEAHDIADALGHSADTLRTLCLDLGQVSVAQSGGQRALFSVSNFEHLQRIWIDSKTVLANMHTLAQEASGIPGAGGEVAVARAKKASHFLRTLPGSLNKLHLSGPAHGLAIEMPYLTGAGGLKQLAVEPAVAKDAVTILKEAGIKMLEVADPRPVLW